MEMMTIMEFTGNPDDPVHSTTHELCVPAPPTAEEIAYYRGKRDGIREELMKLHTELVPKVQAEYARLEGQIEAAQRDAAEAYDRGLHDGWDKLMAVLAERGIHISI